jgi:hypothetical protein
MRIVIILLAMAQPVLAQSRVFVGGRAFADTKKFSGDPSTNNLDGTARGGGAEVGVTLNDRFSLRLNVGVDDKTMTSRPIPIGVLVRPAATPPTAFRSDVSNRIVSTSVLIGYQFPLHDRVHIGAFGGLSFLHVTRDYSTIGPTPTTAAPALVIRPRTLIDNVAAPTVGAEAAFGLTHHLAVVPNLHVSAFTLSNSGPSGFAIRSGIGARWTF